MRAGAALLVVCFATGASAGPLINAHVSQTDVVQISAAVHALSHEPILSIYPVYESKPSRHSTPRKSFTTDIKGPGQTQIRQIVTYERTDRVAVTTGSRRDFKGDSYVVERVGNGWKILAKGAWIR
jgi:hypothetical protein